MDLNIGTLMVLRYHIFSAYPPLSIKVLSMGRTHTISHADVMEGGDHLQVGIGGLVDEAPSQQRQPGNSDSSGGGQEGHHRPLCSVVCHNSNDEDDGDVHNIEGGMRHNGILILPSDGNSVALITQQSATKAKDE